MNEEIFNDENLNKLKLERSDFVKKKAAEVGNIFTFGTEKSQDLEIIEGAIEQSLRTLNELYSSLRTNAPALFEKILVSRFERIEVDKAIFANSDENVEEEQEKVRKRHNVIVSTFSNNLLDPLEKHVKAVQALHEEALLAFSRLEDQKIAPGATGQQNAKSTSTGTLYQASLKL
jgi:hypothetical protein